MSLLIPGLYRHYKGAEYQVISVVTHSETEEPLVLYKALYGEFGLWVRPLNMFVEQVEVDGKLKARFEFIKTMSQKLAFNE